MSEVIVRERYLKNGKKVYEYCFELAHEGGKRRRRTKSGFATKREARAAGRQALYEYENVGEVVVDNNISYSDFLDFWIENDCKNTCKEQTIKGYEKKIKLYIKPELGAYRIKSINKDNLQAFITDLYNDGFSVNTVTSSKGLLTKSFNFAVDRNYIPASPAVNLVIPKNKQPDRPTRFKQHFFLEKDQVDKIFERFPKGTSSFIPLKIAYHTGMRPGEVFGLIWDDIDFMNKTITVNRQVQWYAGKRTEEEKKRTNGTSESNGYWYFCEPKYKSYRTIDIDDTLLDILKEEYEKQQRACEYYDEYYSHYYSDFKVTDEILRRNTVFPQNRIGETCTEHEVNFVCRREDGSYVSSRTMQHVSRIVHMQLVITDYDTYSLRHTHGTMLVEQGADIIYVQRRLGHKSAGAKPVRNPEREKPKWEDTITNRMLHWSYTPEQKEEVKKALAAGVPKATILTYFYPEVTVEKMSSYRKKQ